MQGLVGTPFLRVTRAQALEKGLKYYYVGKQCKYGHDSERFVSTSACVLCNRMKSKGYRSGVTNNINILAALNRQKALASAPGQIPVLARNFAWTEKMRSGLIDAYIDTGSIEQARSSVGLTPSEYHRELERNQEFADAIAKATVLAIQTLEDRLAHAAMVKGDLKAHIPLLRAKRPEEYSERVRVDQTTTHVIKLSEAELDRRIARYADVVAVVDQEPEAGPADAARGKGTAAVAQSHEHPVSGNGAAEPGQVHQAS